MVRALVATLPANAIRLCTRIVNASIVNPLSPVSPVSPVRPGNLVNFRVETSLAEMLEGSALVLAAPAYVTARILRAADEELSRLCDEVPYVSTATIAMAFARSAVQHPLNGSGFVVPRVEKTGILAASWLSSKWAHRAPEGRVLLRVFVGGARDPKALEQSDEELTTRALATIRPLLGIAGDPILTRIYRWDRANAQHEVGHLARMKKIERALAAHPGLFVTGSGFRCVGIPDGIADGRATGAGVARFLNGPVPA